MKTANLNMTMNLSVLQERLRWFGQQGLSLCGRAANGEPLGPAVNLRAT